MSIIKTAVSSPTRIVKAWLTLAVLPIVMYFMAKALNKILTVQVIGVINDCLNAVDYLIWSQTTNTILSILSIAMVISLAKRIGRLMYNENDHD